MVDYPGVAGGSSAVAAIGIQSKLSQLCSTYRSSIQIQVEGGPRGCAGRRATASSNACIAPCWTNTSGWRAGRPGAGRGGGGGGGGGGAGAAAAAGGLT